MSNSGKIPIYISSDKISSLIKIISKMDTNHPDYSFFIDFVKEIRDSIDRVEERQEKLDNVIKKTSDILKKLSEDDESYSIKKYMEEKKIRQENRNKIAKAKLLQMDSVPDGIESLKQIALEMEKELKENSIY